MSGELVRGANRPLSGPHIRARIETSGASPQGPFAIAVLPVGGGAPPCLPLQGDAPPWVDAEAGAPLDIPLRLDALPDDVSKVYLALYVGRAASTLRALGTATAIVDDARIALAVEDLTASALVFAELYRREGAWRLRAKVEGVFEGLEELGRRIGVPVTDRTPGVAPPPAPGAPARPQAWTGSGFSVAPGVLVTNAHVVDGASALRITSFDGTVDGEPVLVDRANDLALVRYRPAREPPPMAFRVGRGPVLGESVHTLGYPLAGLLGSGPQVANGVVSGLLGPDDDVRLVQNTAPIQPGSSGGPLLDAAGLVIGVVSASIARAQNVNFAVRGALAATLLEAAGLDPVHAPPAPARDLVAIAREGRACVFRLECRA